MKYALLALSVTMLAGCSAVKVAHTDVASGATQPRAIYIRSYIAESAKFKGNHGDLGDKAIRRSLAPAEYSKALKEELEKIAPAMVLKEDEAAPTGWLVESDLQWIHSGSPFLRGSPLGILGLGRSFVRIHVRITDVAKKSPASDAKKEVASGTAKEVVGKDGAVIYEFDLNGGSRLSGLDGSVYAPGIGYATPFDYKNAAERVMIALAVDPFKYGTRTSPSVR